MMQKFLFSKWHWDFLLWKQGSNSNWSSYKLILYLNILPVYICTCTALTDCPVLMFHSLTSVQLSIYFAFATPDSLWKAPLFDHLVSLCLAGGQGYHSSSAINVGLSALVDFGRREPSSWACASSYHPGGPAPNPAQTNNSSDEGLTDLTHTHTHTYVFLADQKRLWFKFLYK